MGIYKLWLDIWRHDDLTKIIFFEECLNKVYTKIIIKSSMSSNEQSHFNN